jgi:hypothetical protein
MSATRNGYFARFVLTYSRTHPVDVELVLALECIAYFPQEGPVAGEVRSDDIGLAGVALDRGLAGLNCNRVTGPSALVGLRHSKPSLGNTVHCRYCDCGLPWDLRGGRDVGTHGEIIAYRTFLGRL